MRAYQTAIDGVLVIEVQSFKDERGWFTETYSQRKFSDLGIDTEFVQDNHSYSAKAGTVRGLHFQKDPYAQTKLVRCTRGSIRDVVVDLRKGSPTYLNWVMIELTSESNRLLYIPKCFAHGFLTLEDEVEVQYKVDSPYNKESEGCIRFDDADVGIDWSWGGEIHLSEKDSKAPWLKDVGCDFFYK